MDGLILVAVALAIRISAFSGLTLGDDPFYAGAVRKLLGGEYPSGVFATRPLFLGPLAASVRLVGWSEVGFVLPVLLASVTAIVCAYLLASRYGGRTAGLAAGAVLVWLPIDVVHATALVNDILCSTCLAVAAVLILRVFDDDKGRDRSATIGLAGGVIAGLAAGVKFSAVTAVIPLALLIAMVVWRDPRNRRQALNVAIGWCISTVLLAGFFWWALGDPLANVHEEMSFNRTYMLDWSAAHWRELLQQYPHWAFPLAWTSVEALFPFGLFFWMALAATTVVVFARTHRGLTFSAWWILSFAILEFLPLQLWPSYVPAHRLARFLYASVVPAAVVIGLATSQLLASHRLIARAAGLTAWALYLVTSVGAARLVIERFQDGMADLRFAADLARGYSVIWTDPELADYIRFDSRYRIPPEILTDRASLDRLPAGALVLFGGSRRSDMAPAWVVEQQPALRPEWAHVATFPGMVRPWRITRGEAFVVKPNRGPR
jgi:4-amino-4-deoxy-L-arabinose transferase-like glycosyltransferase